MIIRQSFFIFFAPIALLLTVSIDAKTQVSSAAECFPRSGGRVTFIVMPGLTGSPAYDALELQNRQAIKKMAAELGPDVKVAFINPKDRGKFVGRWYNTTDRMTPDKIRSAAGVCGNVDGKSFLFHFSRSGYVARNLIKRGHCKSLQEIGKNFIVGAGYEKVVCPGVKVIGPHDLISAFRSEASASLSRFSGAPISSLSIKKTDRETTTIGSK